MSCFSSLQTPEIHEEKLEALMKVLGRKEVCKIILHFSEACRMCTTRLASYYHSVYCAMPFSEDYIPALTRKMDTNEEIEILPSGVCLECTKNLDSSDQLGILESVMFRKDVGVFKALVESRILGMEPYLECLSLAVLNELEDRVKILIELGGISANGGREHWCYVPLFQAVQICHIGLVKYLVVQNANVNYISHRDQYKPLDALCFMDEIVDPSNRNRGKEKEIFDFLVKHGAEPTSWPEFTEITGFENPNECIIM